MWESRVSPHANAGMHMPPVRNVSACGCGAACGCHDALRDSSSRPGSSAQRNPGWEFRGRSDPDQEAEGVEQTPPAGRFDGQPVSEKAQRGLGNGILCLFMDFQHYHSNDIAGDVSFAMSLKLQKIRYHQVH